MDTSPVNVIPDSTSGDDDGSGLKRKWSRHAVRLFSADQSSPPGDKQERKTFFSRIRSTELPPRPARPNDLKPTTSPGSEKKSPPLISPSRPALNVNATTTIQNNQNDGIDADVITSRQLGRIHCRSLLNCLSSLTTPLRLPGVDDNVINQLSDLPFNTICLEIRDLYRVLDGLEGKASAGKLHEDDIRRFYEWFEGFFGMLTCTMDLEEEIVFPWITKNSSNSLSASMTTQRRRARYERLKSTCWDILELKLQMQEKPDQRVSLDDLIVELGDELENLALRVVAYTRVTAIELHDALLKNFDHAPVTELQKAVIANLRASEQGCFVLASYIRGFADPAALRAFLEKVYGSEKAIKKESVKVYKNFCAFHIDIADKLARCPSMFSFATLSTYASRDVADSDVASADCSATFGDSSTNNCSSKTKSSSLTEN